MHYITFDPAKELIKDKSIKVEPIFVSFLRTVFEARKILAGLGKEAGKLIGVVGLVSDDKLLFFKRPLTNRLK